MLSTIVCHFAEHLYTKCHFVPRAIMLIVIMLSAIILSATILWAISLTSIILSTIMQLLLW